jgi:hypothetical protein
MQTGRQSKRPSTFEFLLIQEAYNLRRQAEGMPPSIRRDELLRKARQVDVALQVNNWPASPGLRPPT